MDWIGLKCHIIGHLQFVYHKTKVTTTTARRHGYLVITIYSVIAAQWTIHWIQKADIVIIVNSNYDLGNIYNYTFFVDLVVFFNALNVSVEQHLCLYYDRDVLWNSQFTSYNKGFKV